jgi:hypothetical protein
MLIVQPCTFWNDTGMNPCEVDGPGCTSIDLLFIDEK